MIDFYYWPTPNCWKVSIMLEECGFKYRPIPVDINTGEQFSPEFLAVSPNNRVPVIVDRGCDGPPLSVFESAAILVYLAQRSGRFIPVDDAGRRETLEWLFWQAGSLGPMAGQHSHFHNYAPGKESYARHRYAGEYNRCLGVLERRLVDREFILGQYSIVDMACWPLVLIAPKVSQPLDEFPNVFRWRLAIKERSAVRAGVDLGKELRHSTAPTAEQREVLFNQTAQHHRRKTGR